MPGFQRAVRFIQRRLSDEPPPSTAQVGLGDARGLKTIENGAVDAVLTSPPYLNAIDYLRGHRLALVWLGRSLGELRTIRSNSIGAERSPNHPGTAKLFERIQCAMGQFELLPRRHGAMIERYAEDLYRMVSETARVLKSGGTATFVVGNSCLRGTFVMNAAGVIEAAKMVGLTLASSFERLCRITGGIFQSQVGVHWGGGCGQKRYARSQNNGGSLIGREGKLYTRVDLAPSITPRHGRKRDATAEPDDQPCRCRSFPKCSFHWPKSRRAKSSHHEPLDPFLLVEEAMGHFLFRFQSTGT